MITSVDEIPQEIGKIKIYPNPTTDKIEMDLDFEKERDVSIQLIDVNGKLIWTKEDHGRNIKRIESINNLPNGTYFLNFTIDRKEYSQSFRILKIY